MAAGASPSTRSSYSAMRSTFRSTGAICVIGNSGASCWISSSSIFLCSITPSISCHAKVAAFSVSPARNDPRSQVSLGSARLKSISNSVCSATRRAG